ncbi:MAG: Nramp family divalent metal transporter [Clostridia bacterium]|nr:Nramp family divalent metal transporter [Clostridia bacterium]
MEDGIDKSLHPQKPLNPALGRSKTWRELIKYIGPGFIVTLGFIDPGNWATNMAAGANFNYSLLWVITLSTIMLIFLQHMAARLGIITGKSMAENIKEHFPKPLSNLFGLTISIACMATTLAEYLGGALGLKILLGLPLWAGALITFGIVIASVIFQCYRQVERMILFFLVFIAGSYIAQVFITKPVWSAAIPQMFIPSVNSENIMVAMGMMGAVVMSHNIYLHSATVQSRDWTGNPARIRKLLRFEFIDTVLAMFLGWVVNSAMILVAAAVFFTNGIKVTGLEQAAATLKPLAGDAAWLLFGVALFFCGVGSSITASMSSGNIMAGYLGKDLHGKTSWYRVGMTVLSLPPLFIIVLNFDSYQVLLISQVVLSIMLPFTVIPLLLLVKNRTVMGSFASGRIETMVGVIIAGAVIVLNALLLFQFLGGSFTL